MFWPWAFKKFTYAAKLNAAGDDEVSVSWLSFQVCDPVSTIARLVASVK